MDKQSRAAAGGSSVSTKLTSAEQRSSKRLAKEIAALNSGRSASAPIFGNFGPAQF